MFKFTTTTIINNNVDSATGKDRILTHENGLKNEGEVLIKRLGLFKKADVLNVFKAAPVDEKKATATITVPTVKKGDIYRIALYVGLSGSENSYYANDMVFKGKPLFIEAKATNDATQLAKDLVANAEKFITMVYEKKLVELSASGTTLTITATDGHQVFRKAELQHWIQDLTNSTTGEWEVVKDAVIVPGNPGFGTYQHLIHNYVLPTTENTRFGSPAVDDTPIVSGKYTQFLIRMCTDRGIMGGDAVGEITKSITDHVIWAEEAVASTLETALGEVATVVTVSGFTSADKVKVDNDDARLDAIEAKP